MSLHYIVDGYNAIGRFPAFEGKTLRESRRRLCAFLEGRRPHGSVRNKLTVVFDGSARVAAGEEPWPFEVVYSVGEKADDVILARVRAARQPKNCVVVTDDKALAFIVRKYGAAAVSVAYFLGAAAAARQARPQETAQRLYPDVAARERITREMARIWLKKE
ncbi:MAG: NYN domain-containing protein [Deltaproteobacteria bacterium]